MTLEHAGKFVIGRQDRGCIDRDSHGTKRATSNKYESRTDFNRYYKLKIVDNPEGTESDADSWEREDVLAARLIERLEENNRCWMNIVIVERSHGRGK